VLARVGADHDRGERVAPEEVFPRRDRLQVGRVYTAANTAKVIHVKSRWDGSALVFVGKSMSLNDVLAGNEKPSIASIAGLSCPQQAAAI